MQRASVVGAAFFTSAALVCAVPGYTQTGVGVDLDLFSSYVWRGLSLTNKPVAEPGVWISFPAGNASITLGGWANIDLGAYDDPADDISESGGSSGINLSEFDPYAEPWVRLRRRQKSKTREAGGRPVMSRPSR